MMNNPYRIGATAPYGYPAYPTAPGGGYPGGAYAGMVPPVTTGTMFPPPTGAAAAPKVQVPGLLPLEESYIENILRLNLGKVGTFYMTYENNTQWNAKIFKGVIEAAGRDHIIISDPKTGMRFLLLMVNLDYVTFDEELKYFPGPSPLPKTR